MDREIMKGSIDILLLSIIEDKDTYGYEIAKVLKETSNDFYQISEGTLYPALKRMERKDWIRSYWGETENGGRRKYYTITEEGLKVLKEKIKDWQAVNRLINSTTGGV